ncbi:UDP-glucosyltransferase 2-like isoform X3 [Pieris napi]|uniref:UDP-glucosyltransferase 2-like isoform X3 n=1 Tax=Pieris napi TaxID=78633 RepID=UPI001FBBD474|nr:UDP-glucosyltransferase 2-like isoform X3 [Pieris napi]
MCRCNTLLIFLIGITFNDAARILGVFPTPAISHQGAFRPIIHELARRGHQVTVLTPDPAFPKDKPLPNLIEIDVHELSYAGKDEWLEKFENSKEGFLKEIKNIFEKMTVMVEKQIQVPEFKELYKQKFDLLLVESFVRPLLGLGHVFKVPVIQVSSLGAGPFVYSSFGAPSHPLLYHSTVSQRLYNLTLFEKAQELFKNYFVEYIVEQTKEFDYEMMRRNFGEDVPNFEELQKNVQLLLLNEHPIWANNRPVPPNIIFVGGIHQPKEQEFSKELKQILDSSINGVIYVSFGTSVKASVLPPERIEAMTKVLSRLPYDVLWKWDKDDIPGKGKNIKLYKWFPQSSLLKHPKIKLFITQGGLQSTDEAINAAVPLLGIPMLGDQWYNVEKYVHHKIGLQLDIYQLTEDNFRNAVERLIGDKSYKENIVKLRSLMREHPVGPLELAMWWIEHVLKYGGSHLKSPATGMSLMEYYEVPLLLAVTAILIAAITVMLLTAIFVCRMVNCFFKSRVTKKK